MSESVEKLLIRIDASTEQLRRELKAAENAVGKTDKKVRTAQQKMAAGWAKADKAVQKHGKKLAALGAVAIAGLGVAIRKVITNTAAQDKAMAQLEATIKSTGGAAGKTSSELAGTAAELQKITTFGDETIIGAQSLIATFKNIKGDNFDRTTVAVLDMATAMGTDLKSAAIMVGKALNDPKTQMSALSRSGITFTETQKDMVTAMQETGNLAGAQALILAELESQFEGSAEAARNTLGGALQGLSNSFNDLFEASAQGSADLTKAVQELEGVMSDPTTKKAFEEMSAGLLRLSVDAIEGAKAIQFLFREISGMVGGVGNEPLLGDMLMEVIELENQLIRMEQAGDGFLNGFRVRQGDIDEVKEKIKELNGEIENHSWTVNRAREKNQELLDSLQEVTVTATRRGEVALKTAAQIKAEAKETDKLNKVLAAAKKKIDDVTKSLDFEMQQLERNDRQQAQYNALQKAGITITDDSAAAIMEKAGALYDLELQTDNAAQAIVDAEEKAEAATEAAVQAAEDAVAPFNSALQEMAASIDSGFVDGWRDAFNGVEGGFKNFAEKMKDALINLLANMAHMAITRPITIAMTTAMGGMGSTGAAASGGGMTSIMSGFGGSMQDTYAGVASMAYDTFGANSSIGNAASAQAGIYGQGGATAALYGAANVGAGMLGTYAGQQAFDAETTGTGAMVGGAIGSIYGPIGAAIGSFIGEGLEATFFGQDNDGDNRGHSTFDVATGEINSRGEGKSFNQASVDFADMLSNTIVNLAETFGGSTLSGTISIGNNSGIKYKGKSFGDDADALIAAVAKDIVASATNINEAIKAVVANFEGSADDLLRYVDAANGLYESVKSNPVEQALADAVAGIDASQGTMLSFYNEQAAAVTDLIASYDGSFDATVNLNDALQVSRGMAFELATAILAMSDAIGTLIGSQVEYFNEAIMSEEALRAKRIEQRAALVEELRNATDPQEVMDLVNQFAAINRELFDGLNDEQQKAQVETFTALAEEVDNIAQSILGTALADLQLSQEEINAKLVADVTGAGQTIQAAADDLGGHVATFGSLVADLVTRGITINVAGGSEVNR